MVSRLSLYLSLSVLCLSLSRLCLFPCLFIPSPFSLSFCLSLFSLNFSNVFSTSGIHRPVRNSHPFVHSFPFLFFLSYHQSIQAGNDAEPSKLIQALHNKLGKLRYVNAYGQHKDKVSVHLLDIADIHDLVTSGGPAVSDVCAAAHHHMNMCIFVVGMDPTDGLDYAEYFKRLPEDVKRRRQFIFALVSMEAEEKNSRAEFRQRVGRILERACWRPPGQRLTDEVIESVCAYTFNHALSRENQLDTGVPQLFDSIQKKLIYTTRTNTVFHNAVQSFVAFARGEH